SGQARQATADDDRRALFFIGERRNADQPCNYQRTRAQPPRKHSANSEKNVGKIGQVSQKDRLAAQDTRAIK
ncbi:hypothetical protein A249_11447, partial [Pseudomonas syringae pv. actinidiae ICMP 18804]